MNLGLHLIATVLLNRVLQRLINEWPAFLAAAIFATHPFQAEAVNYIFARSTLLETVFCLAAVLAWAQERPWLAAAWFTAGVLSKEECVSFPIFLMLLDLSIWKRIRYPKAIAAMLAVAALAGLRVFFLAQSTPGSAAGANSGFTPAAYALAQGAVLWRYMRMLVLPWGFSVDPNVAVPSLAIGLLAWLALAALVAFAAAKKFFDLRSGFWFIASIVLILPSSSVFPASDLAADRRIYLPMIGFAACIALLLERMRPAALAPLLMLLMGLSIARTQTWKTEESLWSDAMEKAPASIRPKIQLARVVGPARALDLLKQAEAIAPGAPLIAAEEGLVYLRSGHPDLALLAFGRVLAAAPGDAGALNNRGAALLAMGQRDAARQDFERALAVNPCQFDARLNLLRLGASPPDGPSCSFSREQRDILRRAAISGRQ